MYCLQKDDCQPTVDDIDRATAALPLMHSELHCPESAVTSDVCYSDTEICLCNSMSELLYIPELYVELNLSLRFTALSVHQLTNH